MEDGWIDVNYSFSTVGYERDTLLARLQHMVVNYERLELVDRNHWNDWRETILLRGYIRDGEYDEFQKFMEEMMREYDV